LPIWLARLFQVVGALIALAGLSGYWLSRDVPRSLLGEAERALINPRGEFQVGFVVAGRDKLYLEAAGPPIYDARGRIIGREARARATAYGVETDTILYVTLVGNEVTIVAIPRDIYLPEYGRRINAVYIRGGADTLRQAVSGLLGLPVDYYAIINIDIFQRLIDAVGGVQVNVPYRMRHTDHAAGLFIDLQPGPQWLDGERASYFVRYRGAVGDDFRRVDNVKTLAGAFLARVRELNVAVIGALPQLIDTYFDEVETNASPALVAELLPRLGSLQLRAFTLPARAQEGSAALRTDPHEVEAFLAQVFGGQARALTQAPDTTLLITNRSGVPGLAETLRARLVRLGIPEVRLLTRDAALDPTPSRVLAEAGQLPAAAYYAGLLHLGWQQVHRLEAPRGHEGLELVLGQDAATWLGELVLAGAEGGPDN
jgi:LCP family protein required for cell wall assembly